MKNFYTNVIALLLLLPSITNVWAVKFLEITNKDLDDTRTHIRGIYKETEYMKTDRGIVNVSELFGFHVPDKDDPSKELAEYRTRSESEIDPKDVDYFSSYSLVNCFKNSVILDMASGKGSLVKELRNIGIDAHGIDLRKAKETNQCKVKNSVIDSSISNLFDLALFQGSISQMPYNDKSFNRIISTWGPFSYFDGKTKEKDKAKHIQLMKDSLAEIIRVLKDDGMALIGPLAEIYYGDPLPLTVYDLVKQETKNISTIKSYRGIGRPVGHCTYCPYIIITKGNVDPKNFCK
ncbi:MAG: class I SAM-dependent methyltransferase [Oligoflexia bacterium]|nr:class I SAM-dependent methyltransferase [Oligoflexia bacterium]